MANTYTGVEFSENTLIGFLGLKSLEKAKDWTWKTLNPPSYCHPPDSLAISKLRRMWSKARWGSHNTWVAMREERKERDCVPWLELLSWSFFPDSKAEAASPRFGVSVSNVSSFSKTMIRFRSRKLSPEMFKLTISDDESQHLTEPMACARDVAYVSRIVSMFLICNM